MEIIRPSRDYCRTNHAPSERRQRGATLIEFTLVFIVLIFSIFCLVDLGRYFTVRVLLARAAASTLARAQIHPDLQIDFRTLTPASPAYISFLAARRTVLLSGINLATVAMNSPSADPDAMTTLVEYVMTDPVVSAPAPQPRIAADMLLLLPAQHAMVASTGEMIFHPTLTAPGDGFPRDINPTVSLNDILTFHPLVVEIRSSFKPMVPFFPSVIPLKIQVYGPYQRATSGLYPPSRSFPPSLPPLP